ncbi:Heterokaryon incompatibility protein 6, OR allele [Colletotrichum siamense]|uniref:Heterokaryon incompatibility protein 6, OR allele n=1 Tax=Colletotrichum siamense TaxID=690259 RepID=A0A9P5K1Y9_COLSI|nr:Heterokaryon incompatibility protein 6, OR allele [Colletotrichum siamense]KAF4853026.1 Heterokaryon incompatibility protein 6, OR allele [Colletotrichum siamense]
MEHPQPDQDDAIATDEVIAAAGEWLVSLCSKKNTHDDPQGFTPLEQLKFDEFFVLYRQSPVFKRYHVEAVRKCLSKGLKPDYRLARILVEQDDTNVLFAQENDVLQVAIKAVKVEPGLLGQSPKESSPELMAMVELLIEHGASVTCLDEDGNTALFYACSLGYGELFRYLVAAGALLSTEHHRSPPVQLGKPEDGSGGPQQVKPEFKVNLLQVTLDALISPQRIVDMTWVGWPPGVNYDRPMWALDLKDTWGGIILHLLQAGLSYTKDDPGLVMLLHIACYQGALEFVEKLLGYGVATNVAGPRMVDGGQGEGDSFGSALHAAAATSQLPVAKLLMEHGESPRTHRCCVFGNRATDKDKTPLEVAIASGRYGDAERRLNFMEGLLACAESLEESDYQEMIAYCARRNQLDFAKRLLRRGIHPQTVPADVGSLEMARLLISHGAVLDPAAMQKNALSRQQLELLRWCVGEYGPQLASDPESWGKTAIRLISSGHAYLDTIQYLVSEYPGPHVDWVFSARLRRDEKDQPTPTSWLHLAIVRDNIRAMRMLLEAGADPGCPGLELDASTAMRQGQYHSLKNIGERLHVVKMLECKLHGDDGWSLPSYGELMNRQKDAIFKQRRAWDLRLQQLVETRQESPNIMSQLKCGPATTTAQFNAASIILEYTPLPSKSSFRLLELLPSSSRAAPLSGRLVQSDITYQPDYEALSYVWGDASPGDHILIGDHTVPITTNLHSALIHLRHSSEARTLWVDALCIDQSAHGERNQQVMIMGDIYKSARQVVVWLGEAADDSHLVFEHLKDMSAKKSWPNVSKPTPRLRRAWLALITRPWFFRTWVIQEVALSRKAVVMCGEDAAPWMDLGSGRSDISGGANGLSSRLSFPGNPPDHPISGFDADSHIWRLRLLKYGSDPISIMRYSRVCQTSEVEDRVYGILGLFEPGFVTVDYDMPVEQIFRQFTEAVIRLTGDLRVLRCFGVGARTKSLPSWVPDFTDTATAGTLPLHSWHPPYGIPQDLDYRAADGTSSSVPASELTQKILPGMSFRDDGALLLRGKRVDTIRSLGPELPADSAYIPGTDAFARVMREWDALAATLIPGWKKTTNAPSVTRAFAATLAASHGDELHNIDFGYAEWYRHCGAGILEQADPAMMLRDREFYLWWLGVGKRDEEEATTATEVEYELREFAKQMELSCYGRRFFITEDGSMGLAGPRARVGDHVVFFPGTDEPFVLRRREEGEGWVMANDCYLYGLEPYALFQDEERLVEEFVIF